MNNLNETAPETAVLRERISQLNAAILRISASLDQDTVLQEAVASVWVILPHRIGPPLGYGKRRTEVGQEALQAGGDRQPVAAGRGVARRRHVDGGCDPAPWDWLLIARERW